VEEAEEAAAESEPEGFGGLGLKRKRSIVEPKPLERLLEPLEVVPIDWEDPENTIGLGSA